MQFLSIAFCLAAAQATLTNITLGSVSHIPEVDSLPITSLHEGAIMNNLFLTAPGQVFFYDDQDLMLGFPISEGHYQNFSVQYDSAVVDGFGAQPVTFDADDYLVYNGTSEHFFACKNITYDPYKYSEKYYSVNFYKDSAPSDKDCKPIKVKKFATTV